MWQYTDGQGKINQYYQREYLEVGTDKNSGKVGRTQLTLHAHNVVMGFPSMQSTACT